MTDQNHLGDEQSPYLLQHADNPVHWYPWETAAFKKAKAEDKPVFLSIGYATCHWCHVMAHESFEDPEVAAMLNRSFVSIKVDREERPDIDHIYMMVCQMMTGSGGWPLTVVMTPDKKPFYAATYIPKEGRFGRHGMMQLLPRIVELWQEDRKNLLRSADKVTESLQKAEQLTGDEAPSPDLIQQASSALRKQYDAEYGGFGRSPKFPSPHNLTFLLRRWKNSGEDELLEMVTHTLTAMRRGGLFDHVGFGFHRYSTDRHWLLPHFEKMLYDQAMLLSAYAEAWQVTGKPLFRDTAYQIVKYVNRVLRDDNGAYYSAEDADSEGEEGKFYVWTIDEIRRVLDPTEAELFIEVYNLEAAGNFREEASGQSAGTNIPHLQQSFETLAGERNIPLAKLETLLEDARMKLFRERQKRVHPLLDDKILADWNGLMIASLAKAGRIFKEDAFIDSARKAVEFILDRMTNEGRQLLHRYRKGETAIPGHADDYAFMIYGLLELHQATLETRWLEEALAFNRSFTGSFWDDENGGFYFTGSGSEELIARQKQLYDGAAPSANSIALQNLLRLAQLTGNARLEEQADRLSRTFTSMLKESPQGYTQFLQGLQHLFDDPQEVVIAALSEDPSFNKMLNVIKGSYLPFTVLLANPEPADSKLREIAPFLQQQTAHRGKATAYVCHNHRCEKPVFSADDLRKMLNDRQG